MSQRGWKVDISPFQIKSAERRADVRKLRVQARKPKVGLCFSIKPRIAK